MAASNQILELLAQIDDLEIEVKGLEKTKSKLLGQIAGHEIVMEATTKDHWRTVTELANANMVLDEIEDWNTKEHSVPADTMSIIVHLNHQMTLINGILKKRNKGGG